MQNKFDLCTSEFTQSEINEAEKKSLDVLIQSFTNALTEKNVDLVNSMWDKHPALRFYCYGFAIANKTDQEEIILRDVSIKELYIIFRLFLENKHEAIALKIWEINQLLSCVFIGKPFFMDEHLLMDKVWASIPMIALIKNFELALQSGYNQIIMDMWEGNSKLRAWYSGTDTPMKNKDNINEIKTISIPKLYPHFLMALATKCNPVISEMWNNNATLRHFFAGNPITQGQNQWEQPDTKVLLPEFILENFDMVLSTSNIDLICDVWNENLLLGNLINQLDFKNSKMFLNKVMDQGMNNKGTQFILNYLSQLKDVNVKIGVLQDLRTEVINKTYAGCFDYKVCILENHLNNLMLDTKLGNVLWLTASQTIESQPAQFNAPSQDFALKKRNGSPVLRSEPVKKQKTLAEPYSSDKATKQLMSQEEKSSAQKNSTENFNSGNKFLWFNSDKNSSAITDSPSVMSLKKENSMNSISK